MFLNGDIIPTIYKAGEFLKNIKVLVTDDNSKEIFDTGKLLRESGMFVRICPRDGRAILECFMKYLPDVVILDAFPETLDADGIIKRMCLRCGDKKPLIILTSSYCNDRMANEYFNDGADIIFKKPLVSENVFNSICKNFNLQTTCTVPKYTFDVNAFSYGELYTAVGETLIDAGFSPKYLGYKYLKEALVLILNHPEYERSLSKNLYPVIAERYKVTASSVEKNIRSSIEVAFKRKSETRYFYYFSYNKRKPSNAEALNLLSEHIKTKKSVPVKCESFVR